MTWKYQICKDKHGYSLREVFDGHSWSDPINGYYDMPEELIHDLKLMLKDADVDNILNLD